MATAVIKTYPTLGYSTDSLGHEGPWSGLVLRSHQQQLTITTTATGAYNFGFCVPDMVGTNGALYKIGLYIYKDASTPTEDWSDGTGDVKIDVVKAQKAIVKDLLATVVTDKGQFLGSGAFTPATIGAALYQTAVVSLSGMAAATVGIGKGSDNTDQVAYYEVDRENCSAAFVAAQNSFNQGDFIRLSVNVINGTGGTVKPIILAVLMFDRRKL